MSRETITSLKVKIHHIPDEGMAPANPVSVKIEQSTNIQDLFHKTCAQFAIADDAQHSCCLCIADNNVVVANFKVLGKYLI